MLKILVVDNEPIQLDGLSRLIKDLKPDFQVVKASNGQEALEATEKQHFDAVFCDIKMPLLDGLSFVEKSDLPKLDTKIIFVSGYRDFAYAQQAIRLQASDYLLKPVDMDEVKIILDKLDPVKGDDKNRQVMQSCLRYINENITSNLSLETVAKKFYFSAAYFSSFFKSNTGISFSRYVTEQKIARAKTLLQNPKNKVHDVARALGYDDPNYFHRVFKKQTHMTPEEFRRMEIHKDSEEGRHE